jgi:hypothetical protein
LRQAEALSAGAIVEDNDPALEHVAQIPTIAGRERLNICGLRFPDVARGVD